MTDDIDPIEEIHKIRKEMYAQAGGTPAAFVKYLRALEKKRAEKLTKRAPAPTPRKAGKRGKPVAP